MRNWMMAVLITALMISAGEAGALVPAQNIMKGQSSTVEFDYEIGDVAVADTGVCDYLVGRDRRSLYINGLAGGETKVTVWDSSGAKRDEFDVRVVTTTLKEVLDRAHAEFGDLSGVEIQVKGGRVEVAGEVAEPQDFRRIEGAAKQDFRIKSRVKLAGDIIGQISDAIARAMEVPGVTVRSIRDRIALEGVAYSQADAKRAVEIAKIYSPEVLDLIDVRETKRQVGRGRMIELSFHMMEVKKSAMRELGISWAPGAFPAGGGTASAGGGGGAGLLSSVAGVGRELIGFVMQLVPRLKFLRERGDARVLENPSVIVKSGEPAKIFSGMEVPYYRGEEVQFKKVGIEIDVEPVEVGNGVDMRINATLSSLTADVRGAIDTHTVSTSAICPLGQSMVIGNIVRNGDVKMKNRRPRDIDTSSALFALFLSKDFQSNRSEFVMFVTPRIVESPSPAEAQMREFMEMQDMMIRDRSKKEFAEFKERGGSGDGNSPEDGAEKTKTKRPRRRWR